MYYSVVVTYDKIGWTLLASSVMRRVGKMNVSSRINCTSPYQEIEYYFDTLDETIEFLQGLWLPVDKL